MEWLIVVIPLRRVLGFSVGTEGYWVWEILPRVIFIGDFFLNVGGCWMSVWLREWMCRGGDCFAQGRSKQYLGCAKSR